MKRVLLILIILAMLIPSSVMAAPADSATLSVQIPGGPKFWIGNVVRNESVTVGFANYPTDTKPTYNVYLGLTGNSFGNGYLVGYVKNKKKSSFKMTFNIPKELKGQTYIAIYIWDKSDNSHGYDIFANDNGFNARTPLSLGPVHRSSEQSAGKSVGIFNGPTFWAGEKGYKTEFTLRFVDYFNDDKYVVTVGSNVGASAYERYVVGYVEKPKGTRLTKTFTIPAALRSAPEIKVRVENIFNGHTGSVAFKMEPGYPYVHPEGLFTEAYLDSGTSTSRATPFTNVLNVVKDGEVTLQVFNFPPGLEFTVTMGPMGTKGIGGYVVGTQSSGEGGTFIVTYPIPPQLYGMELISIRLQSTSTGHFAYDYFQNEDGYNATSSGVAYEGDWLLPAGVYPSTSVVAVKQDTSVTISGYNFTKNDTYTVRMGPIGTQGVGGIIVGTYSTGASSSFTATFNIPAALIGSYQIAIRFESNNTSYYAYDWFYNSTFP